MKAIAKALVGAAVLASGLGLSLPVSASAGPGGAAQPALETVGHSAAVEVVRLWGQDRYGTSLAVARELVSLRGGRVEAVVLAAGPSVETARYRVDTGHNAAIAASLAGRLDAPMLFVPPGGLGSEAMALLRDSEVSTAFVVGSRRALPATDLLPVIRAGIHVERAVGPVAAARLVGFPEREGAPVATGSDADDVQGLDAASQPVRAVVLFSELRLPVAAALAARAKLPLLDFPEEPLAADETAQFIRDHRVTHALLSSGYVSQRASMLADLGVTAVPIGDWLVPDWTAASIELSSDGADSRFASLSQRECPAAAPTTIGIASEHNLKRQSHWAVEDELWDAYSAAPLLGWLCSPLLLTHPHRLGVDANAALYRAQLSGTASVHVFGGTAAVRESVAEHAASPDVPVRVAVAIKDPSSDAGDQVIAVIDERQQVRRYLTENPHVKESRYSIFGELSWSPQRSHIAFTGSRDGVTGVFILELATEDVWRVTPANSSYPTDYESTLDWSPDGALLAMSAYPFVDVSEATRVVNAKKEVLIADIRDKSVRWLTRNNERDIHGAWSPVGHRLVIFRAPAIDDWPGGSEAELVEIVGVDARTSVKLRFPGVVTEAQWSPDGSHLAIVTYEDQWTQGYSGHGTVHVVDADGTTVEPVQGPVTGLRGWASLRSWAPDGCCIAAFSGISGATVRVVDAATGSYRDLTESSGTHRGGINFRLFAF